MTRVINIRATSGGGKSTLMRQFLRHNEASPLKNTRGKTFAYRVSSSYGFYAKDVFILGPYENPTGGCDCISSQDAVCDLIREFSKVGHVIFEGLIISGLFSRYRDLADELRQSARFTFGYLDTPLEVCVKHVLQRRAAAGNHAPFDPERTLVPKFRSVLATKQKFFDAGCEVRALPYRDALTELELMLHQSADL